jgi:membrane fusion protein (multidrug efflux system)
MIRSLPGNGPPAVNRNREKGFTMRKRSFFAFHGAASLCLVCSAVLAACSSGKAAAPPNPPPEVGVVTLHPQPVTITTDLPGRTVAYRIAEVRPQVSGVIVKRLFTEGSEVKAGQQLYQIDPAPFQANLESAQASLARARATLKSAALLAQRYKPLAEAHAVSQQNYDNAIAAESQAAADIALAKAAVDTAHINLAYTRMFSPISGRTGRSSVTEGALVDANQRTALVVVQQLDPIYVDVTQPSTMLLRLQREFASGQLKKVGESQARAQLMLEDNIRYEQAGKLQFAEVTVDSGTGSVTLRAVFPNPQHTLLPGMFVHEQLQEGVNEQGLLVPQRAITRNSLGDATTMVVGADNMVSTRVIKTERAIGDQWLVSDGVAAGDKVIVIGLQRLGSGVVKVKPTEVSRDQLNGERVAAANPTGVEGPANSQSRLKQ